MTVGRDLGWPYCNPDADGASPPFARDVQTNPDGSKLDCAALPRVEQTLSAHAAPLGLSFADGGLPAPYTRGALAGVHGSWNREPPRAPEVSFFAWQNGTLGNQQTLVGGFQAPDGSRWGRPVAAVLGPDGALYVADDDAGSAPTTRSCSTVASRRRSCCAATPAGCGREQARLEATATPGAVRLARARAPQLARVQLASAASAAAST